MYSMKADCRLSKCYPHHHPFLVCFGPSTPPSPPFFSVIHLTWSFIITLTYRKQCRILNSSVSLLLLEIWIISRTQEEDRARWQVLLFLGGNNHARVRIPISVCFCCDCVCLVRYQSLFVLASYI